MSEQKELVAGRGLDALIAEKVMGYQWWRSSSSGNRSLFAKGKQPEWFKKLADGTEPLVTDWKMVRLPAFSTSIADAHSIVDKMTDFRWVIERGEDGWTVMLDTRSVFWTATGETAAEAICRAALSAVEAQ